MLGPKAHYLWVCTKHRPEDGKASCAARGGEALARDLKSAIVRAGINARVCTSGCFDLCAAGPSIVVMPEGRFLCRMTNAAIPELVRQLAEPGRSVIDNLESHRAKQEDWE